MESVTPPLERITTIDILRALTMVLMIFVNDLWSLTNIPAWLGHVERGVDGIGLADVVFPAFLFIVGLSIPYAMENRRKKGDSDWDLIKHVLWRTIALLVMGMKDKSSGTRPAWYSILRTLKNIHAPRMIPNLSFANTATSPLTR